MINFARGVKIVVNQSAKRMRRLTRQLSTGGLDLDGWRDAMTGEIKLLHTSAALAGAHGREELVDQEALADRIAEQLDYLDGFAAAVASGEQELDGTALSRAAMYARAARGTQSEAERDVRAGDEEYQWERRVLGDCVHCQECLEYAARGWQPIGTLPAIGEECPCLTNCGCRFEYSAELPSSEREEEEESVSFGGPGSGRYPKGSHLSTQQQKAKDALHEAIDEYGSVAHAHAREILADLDVPHEKRDSVIAHLEKSGHLRRDSEGEYIKGDGTKPAVPDWKKRLGKPKSGEGSGKTGLLIYHDPKESKEFNDHMNKYYRANGVRHDRPGTPEFQDPRRLQREEQVHKAISQGLDHEESSVTPGTLEKYFDNKGGTRFMEPGHIAIATLYHNRGGHTDGTLYVSDDQNSGRDYLEIDKNASPEEVHYRVAKYLRLPMPKALRAKFGKSKNVNFGGPGSGRYPKGSGQTGIPKPLSPGEVQNFAATHFQQHAEHSPEEAAALDRYKQLGAFSINDALRTRGDKLYDEEIEKIRHLDKAIAKGSVIQPVLVHRGIQSEDFARDAAPGTVIPHPGFVSTSVDPDYAAGFFGTDSPENVMLHIHVPEGMHAAYLPEGPKGNESELLLPRGTPLRITHIEPMGQGRRIYAKALPQKPKPLQTFPERILAGNPPADFADHVRNLSVPVVRDLASKLKLSIPEGASGTDARRMLVEHIKGGAKVNFGGPGSGRYPKGSSLGKSKQEIHDRYKAAYDKLFGPRDRPLSGKEARAAQREHNNAMREWIAAGKPLPSDNYGGEVPSSPDPPQAGTPSTLATTHTKHDYASDTEAFHMHFHAAFHRLDRLSGGHNFVSLVDLRKHVPVPRAVFDRELNNLRRANKYTLSHAEGRHGISEEERQAGIYEGGSYVPLLHVSRKEN